MKLEARWIEETGIEFCIVCRQYKAGRFLIIYLPNNRYLAICEACYQRRF